LIIAWGKIKLKKKGLAKTFALFIFVLFVSCASAFDIDNPSEPLKNGNWLYVGGSGPGNYTRIQDAIDASNADDTVFVYNDSSPYYEEVLVEKTINLIGEDKNTTIINGSPGFGLILRDANWINISGFTIENNGLNIGLLMSWTSYDLIQDNIIMHGNDGFHLGVSSYNLIQNNKICFNLEEGLSLHSSPNNIIRNNIISSNYGEGIVLEGNYHNYDNITITNNIIINNSGGGIHIKGSYNNIYGNTIINNGNYGVKLLEVEYRYTDYNIINENNFLNNDYGIHISSDSYPPNLSCNNNLIYHNNFIINQINAFDENSNIWDNGYSNPFDPQTDGGNYWNNYTGNDIYSGPEQNIPGSDGIGDSPYPISGGSNLDGYPFVSYYFNDENLPPNTPTIEGGSTGKIFKEYNFTISVLNNEFECLFYFIDWGDGTHGWIGPCLPDEEIALNHTWIEPGSFIIKAKVRDIFYVNSDWSDPFTIEISQDPPNKPTILGPLKGDVGQNYVYNFSSTDPEGQIIKYFIDWGDGSNSSWVGPYLSGEVVSKQHRWIKRGRYKIKVKAMDVYDAEGVWSDPLSVIMPRERTLLISQFIQSFNKRIDLFLKNFIIIKLCGGFYNKVNAWF
jgi:parallel beta-helix repeat protein